MNHVTRIHLKTSGRNRNALIDFCLNNEHQCLAIGWSYVYESNKNISNYQEFYCAVKNNVKRINHVLNVFWNAKENDLFWTRDLAGNYWICRVTGPAESKYVKEWDIGAILPVEAYKLGLEVSGQIKASFNRPRGGTSEDIYDEIVVEYSKLMYNRLSGKSFFSIEKKENNVLDNLPDFDLEELVISYLQLKENYYVLSNSIANKSTTVKIECELIGRNKEHFKKAVVQVKGGSKDIDAADYILFDEDGYYVYLYASNVKNLDKLKNCIVITRDELLSFYKEYKEILPKSITKWEDLLK